MFRMLTFIFLLAAAFLGGRMSVGDHSDELADLKEKKIRLEAEYYTSQFHVGVLQHDAKKMQSRIDSLHQVT